MLELVAIVHLQAGRCYVPRVKKHIIPRRSCIMYSALRWRHSLPVQRVTCFGELFLHDQAIPLFHALRPQGFLARAVTTYKIIAFTIEFVQLGWLTVMSTEPAPELTTTLSALIDISIFFVAVAVIADISVTATQSAFVAGVVMS